MSLQISLLVCKRGDVWSDAIRWNLPRVRTTMVTVQQELNDHFGVPVLIEYEAGAGALAPLRSQVCASPLRRSFPYVIYRKHVLKEAAWNAVVSLLLVWVALASRSDTRVASQALSILVRNCHMLFLLQVKI